MHVFSYILKALPDFRFRFDEQTERLFLADYIGKSQVVIRAGYFLCIFLYAIFGLLDIWIVPETVNIAWFIRFAIVIPILLFTIIVSFTDFFKRFNQIILIVTSAIVGLGIVVMIAYSRPTELGYKYYYSGLMLVIFWIYTFIRLRFWNSIIAALIITLGYEFIAIFIQHLTASGIESKNMMVFINNNFFFISANIIGLWASYHIEKLQRSNFLQNRIIIDENVRIQNFSDMLMHKNEEILAQSAMIESQSKRLFEQNNLLEEQSQSTRGKNEELLVLNEEIRTKSKELSQANIELEEKVQERTEELQKSNNELIISRDKAQASDLLKTAFMNNISHEVRTPLNGIMGFGSLLTDPNLTTEERQQYNQLLKASGNRLINTITDYMDISLIASGNIEVSHKPVNVPDLLKELQTKFRDSCDVKNLVLNLAIPAELEHFTLITDAELLRKIIDCLLDNAIKFTSLGSITFGYSVKTNTIDFFVIDTGIGIPPEFHERIFEPFAQEDISDTRGYEGSGLGLSIISGFLKLLGGEICLESDKGQGASFFFSLPMEPGTTEENEPIPPLVLHAEIIRPVVLVAEDDLSNDLYMEIILKSFASVVFTAANGKEAVEKCRMHPEISLVLMDLKMPVMDGFEATRQIKSFRKELPIIAITAYAFSKDKKKALEIGCDDFLLKPFSKHDLLEKFKKFGFLG
jgi:signal transduction histidine kinase